MQTFEAKLQLLIQRFNVVLLHDSIVNEHAFQIKYSCNLPNYCHIEGQKS